MHWLTKCQLIDIVVSESRASTSFKQAVGFVCAVIAMYDCVSIKQYIFCQFRFKISFKYVAKMLALFVMNTLKLKNNNTQTRLRCIWNQYRHGGSSVTRRVECLEI